MILSLSKKQISTKMKICVTFFLICICSMNQNADAQQSSQDGDIRLAGTNSNATHGRVEIFHNNVWGTVCDDGFEFEEATVVCRQLGHATTGATALAPTLFGNGTGPIWIDDLACDATEQRLQECPFGGWNQSDCKHNEDVGVGCIALSSTPKPVSTLAPTKAPIVPETGNCTQPDTTIRLLGPVNKEGMGVVQIFKNGIWGGVCDDGWNIYDAMVVCRVLCYDPLSALPGSDNMDTSNITNPMVVKSMGCSGTETSLNDCPQSPWANNSCGSNEMARVTCIPMTYTPVRPQPNLTCTDGLLTASFSTLRDTKLEPKHLTIPAANGKFCIPKVNQTATEISIGIPFDQCETTRTFNATHIIYNNTIRYASTYTSSNGQVTKANTYMIEIKCALPKDVTDNNVNEGIVPITETVTQTATGQFIVALQFYRNNSFSTPVTQFPLEIPLGEWLNAALVLTSVDANLRLVVHNCTATPTANPNDPIRYPLFIEKCVEDPTVGFFPLNESWFGWRYQTFKFVQFGEVYIHCDALVCDQAETNPVCDRSCFPSAGTTTTTTAPTTTAAGTSDAPGSTPPVGRRKRSASYGIRSFHVSSRSIYMYDPNEQVQIERPGYTVLPDNVTTSVPTTHSPPASSQSSSQAPPQTPSKPITTKKPSTQNTDTPKPSTHAPSQESQTPSSSQKPSSDLESENSDLTQESNKPVAADSVVSGVFSTAPAFMFSLFTLTQLILCITLFYMLI